MYEYIEGKCTIKKVDFVAIDCNGVGYKVFISLQTYNKIELNENIRLYIHNYVREDNFKLIGFTDERERELFEILLNVNGIGVALALSILSTFNVSDLKRIVASEDTKLLTKVPKLGVKKAQKLIVDVKDKMKGLTLIDGLVDGNEDNVKAMEIEEDIYLALGALGYSDKDIKKFIKPEDIKNYSSIEDAIKQILKKIQSSK